MTQGFVKLFREKAIELLETDPKAFLLFSHIALRARRSDAAYSGLKINQAFIGDHNKIGLSRQEYRHAKQRLEKYNLASFNPTNKGTIATLLSTSVYDINADETFSKQPSDFPMKTRENQPINNQPESIQKPSEAHQEAIKKPLTRKEECKNSIMKENPPPHSPQTFREPETLEDWKRKMISHGWTDKEFNEAWSKCLLQPPGSIQNVRRWLESVMQSIRDSEVKEGHLRQLAQTEAQKKFEEDKTARLEHENIEAQQAKKVQENTEFMRKIHEIGTDKEKYELTEKYVKLLGGRWNGFCLAFSENDFLKTVKGHLEIDD